MHVVSGTCANKKPKTTKQILLTAMHFVQWINKSKVSCVLQKSSDQRQTNPILQKQNINNI